MGSSENGIAFLIKMCFPWLLIVTHYPHFDNKIVQQTQKNDWARSKEILPEVMPYRQNPALVAQDGFVVQSSWSIQSEGKSRGAK